MGNIFKNVLINYTKTMEVMKLKKKLIAICSIMLFVLLLFVYLPPHQVNAADTTSYFLAAYNINVQILKDGSADIEERLSYNYSGQFNGALRNVDFSGTKGFSGQSVFVLKNDALEQWKLNVGNPLDASGQPGTYNFEKADTLAKFKIFEPSSNELKTFVIKYKFVVNFYKFKTCE